MAVLWRQLQIAIVIIIIIITKEFHGLCTTTLKDAEMPKNCSKQNVPLKVINKSCTVISNKTVISLKLVGINVAI